jgi:hypothetical protein
MGGSVKGKEGNSRGLKLSIWLAFIRRFFIIINDFRILDKMRKGTAGDHKGPLTPTYSFRSSIRDGENEERPLVILSEAKDLARWAPRFFADAQNDT